MIQHYVEKVYNFYMPLLEEFWNQYKRKEKKE
jgi:hypothetical protein